MPDAERVLKDGTRKLRFDCSSTYQLRAIKDRFAHNWDGSRTTFATRNTFTLFITIKPRTGPKRFWEE